MSFPAAWFRPVRNHGGPMAAHDGLVFHSQEGNGSLFEYFDNPASQVSSHLWAAKDGRLEQYVDETLMAWAQGDGNGRYLSLEAEGFHDEPLTSAQLLTMAAVALRASVRYAFPLELVDHGSRGLTTHAHYPSGQPDVAWGGHPCPGSVRSAQLPLVVALARQTPSEEDTDMFLATGAGAEWVVTGCGRFQVADPSDGPGLLARFGQTEMVPLSAATLANIPVLPRSYASPAVHAT